MISGYSVENTKAVIAFLRDKRLNDYAIAGLLGNFYCESKLYSNNLQNSFNTKLMKTDEQYTREVDDNIYTEFDTDRAGYGLAQWTSEGRKTGLHDLVKRKRTSIGNINSQLEWLWTELNSSYRTKVLIPLQTVKSVREAAEIVVCKFEVPKSVLVDEETKQKTIDKRAAYSQDFYDEYLAGSTPTPAPTPITFTNSPLVTYTKISPNRTSPRKGKEIKYIIPHCVVGQVTVERLGDIFANPSKEASSNYGIGKDGRIAMYCEEKDRAWCTGGTDAQGNPIRVNGISGADVDQIGVSIECASDSTAPYAFYDVVFNSLVELCTDICKRYGKTKTVWISDKEQAMRYKPAANEMVFAAHRWFSRKSCPGDWMYARMGDLSAKVNAKLSGSPEPTPVPPTPTPIKPDPAQSKDKSLAGTYEATTALNIRYGAGTDKAKICCVPQGQQMKNYGYYTSVDGVKWLYLQLTYKGSTFTGYACSTYLRKIK
ncbi:MAG: N-acetylmuramoyl-L-alanine amidase [Bacilli bacterium]|nr:N-acetylmuramoyl-L-alanine amidase [Bacilli bacterium]